VAMLKHSSELCAAGFWSASSITWGSCTWWIANARSGTAKSWGYGS
jgi:hypothetical protein